MKHAPHDDAAAGLAAGDISGPGGTGTGAAMAESPDAGEQESDLAFLAAVPGAEALAARKREEIEGAKAKKPEPEAGAKPETEEPAKGDAEPKEPKAPEAMQRRIDKLVAQRNEAREEIDELKAELDALKERGKVQPDKAAETGAGDAARGQASAADGAETSGELEALTDRAERVYAWCIQNLDGGTVRDDKGQEIELDAAEVRRRLVDADMLLRKHIPRRRQYIEAREALEAKAKDEFPFLGDPEAEEYQQVQRLLNALPEVRRFPDFLSFAATWAQAEVARAKRNKPAGKQAPAGQPPRGGAPEGPAKAPPAAPTSAAAAAPKPQPGKEAVEAALQSGGTEESLVSFFRN